MKSPFLKMLWQGRQRPSAASVQERIARAAVRTGWDVKATPQRDPISRFICDDPRCEALNRSDPRG